MSRRAKIIIAVTCFSALALLAVSIFEVPPRLLYNPSPSAPKGFYRVHHAGRLKPGDMVAAKVPESMRSLAVERGYLPGNVPVVKRIVAVEGDHVCFRDGVVYLNSDLLVKPLDADFLGRPMPVWKGCQVLAEGEFFLAMTDVPTSLDSRYFGPVTDGDILGRTVPVEFLPGWTSPPDPRCADPGYDANRPRRPEGKIKATAPWDG